ncbi:MAG: nucleoside kinase [Spirochaetaceae bacterium]|jgi:uridine kinase|nr:nucleoside kinase [Spirochaetaceae bacterium]
MSESGTIEIRFSHTGKGGAEEGKAVTCPFGIPVDSFLESFGEVDGGLAAVYVNNEILPLSTRLEINCTLTPISLACHDGVVIYRRSLAFLLAIAARDLFPSRRLTVGHSLGHSYYYTFANGKKPGGTEIKALEREMRAMAADNLPISCGYMAYGEALTLFEQNHQEDTLLLFEQRSESKVRVNRCRDFADLYVEPLVNRTGVLDAFELMEYGDGLLLRFPATGQGKTIERFEDSPSLFSVYQEYKKWGNILGVRAVGQLNRLVSERKVKEYIRIAESFQAKKMAEIADRIYERRNDVRIILIAGPSSSGKTTTAKWLSIQLQVMGMSPISVSLDDYYRNPGDAPKDEQGRPDLECLEALDVPYLNRQLVGLLEGKEVDIPVFDFKTGTRKTRGRPIKLDSRSVLIMEGIHGLNDACTPQVERKKKFKLYVSALTQINLDDHNRIPTSENRLLRRMVRDNQFRGTGAAKTIQMWPSVQAGERKHIFPFQDGADMAFNSALDYELAVLKFYADPLLRSVKPTMPEYAEARRILSFLENFAPIPPQYVSGTSILREFIGDSEFKY